MDFLKEWTYAVCLSLICAVIFSLFTPEGKMKRFYKLLLSLFIFFSFLLPLKNLPATAQEFANLSRVTADTAVQEEPYQRMIEAKVKGVLEYSGIHGAVVTSDVAVNDVSGEIAINKVSIAVGDQYEKENVKEIIFQNLGILAEVRGIGE